MTERQAHDTERPGVPDITGLDQYQVEAERTMGNNTLQSAILGLCGESGELADLLKKHIAQGHPFDTTKAIKELGDVLWYVAVAARKLGANLSEVAQQNSEKLRGRYPSGFETHRSLHREFE